jgi:hypothetical protein
VNVGQTIWNGLRIMTRSEKIFIGPKTILTPSARGFGMEDKVFVETEARFIR